VNPTGVPAIVIAPRAETSPHPAASDVKPTRRITILLADDHIIFREGLRGLLKTASGFKIVGEAATGREAVELAAQLNPLVVVMDIAMPQLNGIEACRQIIASQPETRVILLSAHSDDEFIERAAEVGAVGYLVKQNSAEQLVRAIREVAEGNRFFSPSIARRMHIDSARMEPGNGFGHTHASPATRLTPRQKEVLQLVAEGAPNKQVAAALGISIKTVEKHRQQLMDKLDIHDTAGLTRYAIAARLVESSVQVTIT
jgi:DNA-binding NarL/FixJ family response regulator